MSRRKWHSTVFLTFLWCLIAFISLGTATYAWFTFSPSTNVEPMSSTISQGGASLLISDKKDGEFETECALPQKVSGQFSPISTRDLERFYVAVGQNKQGVSISYRERTGQIEEDAIHGTIYLKSKSGSCNVYFYRPGLDFGSDSQVLSALRLGMRFKKDNDTETYIFRLDEMGNTAGAERKQTVPRSGTVVSSVTAGGSASYVNDPSQDISVFFASIKSNDDKEPENGTQPLCTIQEDEIVEVEYWLYLEGCDDNCINAVQARDIRLQLSFAGVTAAGSGTTGNPDRAV